MGYHPCMSITTKAVALDAVTGAGVVNVAPGYFVGVKAGAGVTSVTAADGQSLGTAFLTRGTEIGVEGRVDVQGTPGATALLYFDF